LLRTLKYRVRLRYCQGGLSADQILRILLVKQMNGYSYRTLAFHLADSHSYRTFCRLGITDKLPSKSALNAYASARLADPLLCKCLLQVDAASSEKTEFLDRN
jgi:hypothetical protein